MSMVWSTLGSRTAKEQEQKVVTIVNSKLCHLSTMGRFIALNPRHVLRLLKSRYFFRFF